MERQKSQRWWFEPRWQEGRILTEMEKSGERARLEKKMLNLRQLEPTLGHHLFSSNHTLTPGSVTESSNMVWLITVHGRRPRWGGTDLLERDPWHSLTSCPFQRPPIATKMQERITGNSQTGVLLPDKGRDHERKRAPPPGPSGLHGHGLLPDPPQSLTSSVNGLGWGMA